jgi:hypothetical protein
MTLPTRAQRRERTCLKWNEMNLKMKVTRPLPWHGPGPRRPCAGGDVVFKNSPSSGPAVGDGPYPSLESKLAVQQYCSPVVVSHQSLAPPALMNTASASGNQLEGLPISVINSTVATAHCHCPIVGRAASAVRV